MKTDNYNIAFLFIYFSISSILILNKFTTVNSIQIKAAQQSQSPFLDTVEMIVKNLKENNIYDKIVISPQKDSVYVRDNQKDQVLNFFKRNYDDLRQIEIMLIKRYKQQLEELNKEKLDYSSKIKLKQIEKNLLEIENKNLSLYHKNPTEEKVISFDKTLNNFKQIEKLLSELAGLNKKVESIVFKNIDPIAQDEDYTFYKKQKMNELREEFLKFSKTDERKEKINELKSIFKQEKQELDKKINNGNQQLETISLANENIKRKNSEFKNLIDSLQDSIKNLTKLKTSYLKKMSNSLENFDAALLKNRILTNEITQDNKSLDSLKLKLVGKIKNSKKENYQERNLTEEKLKKILNLESKVFEKVN